MANAEAEVKKVNAEIRTKTIVFDFSSYYSEDTYGVLLQELDAIEDVSILVNNVGVLFQSLYA